MLTDGRTDVRTDERTNGRKLARLCLPAKAGATKITAHPRAHQTAYSSLNRVGIDERLVSMTYFSKIIMT